MQQVQTEGFGPFLFPAALFPLLGGGNGVIGQKDIDELFGLRPWRLCR